MYKGWTNFNRVLMGLSMGVCFVLIAVVVIYFRNIWWVWLIGCICIFMVFAMHCIWGLFVEMSQNLIFLSEKIMGDQGEKIKKDTRPWKCNRCGNFNPASSVICGSCGQQKSGQ